MKKWEYQWVPGRRDELHQTILKAMGTLGWESYAVTEGTTSTGMANGEYTVWLKRPIQAIEEE